MDSSPVPPASVPFSAWQFIAPSNLVSYVSLAAGALSIHFAATGSIHLMAACWGLAALADNFDGAFARLFKRTEVQAQFGQELDSLIDAVAFGLAPVAGLGLVSPHGGPVEPILFAVAAFAYLLALVTRLGHFNIAQRQGYTVFRGVPSTEAALSLATLLLIPDLVRYAWVALLMLAWLMLAPITIRRPKGAGRVALIIWLVGVPAAHLWLQLTAGAMR